MVKYFAENTLDKKVSGVFIVAAPFGLSGFVLPDDLSGLERAGDLYFYHSKDDPVVPFKDLEKYQGKLPSAVFRVFEDRKHFNQDEFPELVEDIRKLGK